MSQMVHMSPRVTVGGKGVLVIRTMGRAGGGEGGMCWNVLGRRVLDVCGVAAGRRAGWLRAVWGGGSPVGTVNLLCTWDRPPCQAVWSAGLTPTDRATEYYATTCLSSEDIIINNLGSSPIKLVVFSRGQPLMPQVFSC